MALPNGVDGFAPSKRDVPLKDYSENERVRLAILGLNDLDGRINAGNYSSILEINEIFAPVVLAEGVGSSMLGTSHGYVKLDNNRLSVSISVDVPNKQALKNSDFYPARVDIYHKDHLILTKSLRVNPDNPHIYPTGHKHIGEMSAIIPEHYRHNDLKVVATLEFQYNSGAGVVSAGNFTTVKREIRFR